MKPIDPEKLLALLRVIDEEWTDGLCQNSVVMSRSRQGKEDASRLVEGVGPESQLYGRAWSAFTCFQEILQAEEGEDLRQKGISGLWERHKADFIHVIKFYAQAQKEASRAD